MEGMKSNAFLETERVGTLMRKYSIPCILSLVVAALYNIVDQIFIANADYLGSYGNAANTVVFPLTVVALAVAVMIGDGCCAFVSISLGAGRNEDAHRSIGSAILLCLGSSAVLTAVYLLCMDGKGKNLGVRLIAEGNVNAAEVTTRGVVEAALSLNATQVILAHNHVSGLALPSEEDRATTCYLAKVLGTVGVTLADHLIVVDDDMVSLRESGFRFSG